MKHFFAIALIALGVLTTVGGAANAADFNNERMFEQMRLVGR